MKTVLLIFNDVAFNFNHCLISLYGIGHNRLMDKYQNTIKTFNNVAEAYWQKFKDFQLYQPTYDWFCEHLADDHIDLLEIACGPGNVSHYLLNKKPKIKLLGIDLAPNMVKLAQQHNQQATYQVMDCRSIDSIEQTFDAIICGFCIPYLSWQDSQVLFQNMYQLMKSGSILYLSTTEGKHTNEGYQGSKSATGAIYVHYHDIEAIQLQLDQVGMDVIGVKRLTHIHNKVPTTDVFILAKKPN